MKPNAAFPPSGFLRRDRKWERWREMTSCGTATPRDSADYSNRANKQDQ